MAAHLVLPSKMQATPRIDHRTLYAYFSSREEIYLVVFLEGLRMRADLQRSAMDAAKNGYTKVRAWGEAFYAFARNHPHNLRIQAYWDYRGIDETRVRPEIFAAFCACNEEIITDLRAAIRLGIRDNSLRRPASVDMLISHYADTLRIVLNRARFPGYSFGQFDPNEYIGQYLNLFLRSIAKSPRRTT